MYKRWMRVLRWTIAVTLVTGLIGIGFLHADLMERKYSREMNALGRELTQMVEEMTAVGQLVPYSEDWDADTPISEMTDDQQEFELAVLKYIKVQSLRERWNWDIAPSDTETVVLIFSLFVFAPALVLLGFSALLRYIFIGPGRKDTPTSPVQSGA